MTNPSGWWSNQTLDNYNTVVRQCVVDLYTNLTQGPYVMKNGKDGFVSTSVTLPGVWYAMRKLKVY